MNTRIIKITCMFLFGTVISACNDNPENKIIAMTGFKLFPSSITLVYEGTPASQQIIATAVPENASNVAFSWKSEEKTVATVSQAGLVTARGAGSTQITVTSDNISKTIPVTVTAPVISSDAIVVFDLKYTRSYNLNDNIQTLNAWDDVHTIATLQGVVNRNHPRLFINYVVESGIDIDAYWWDKYGANAAWLQGRSQMTITGIEQLIEHFSDAILGAVVYDSDAASTGNVASAVAGIESLVAIRYDTRPQSLYSRLVLGGPKLDVKVWLVGEDGKSMFTGSGTVPGTGRSSTGSVKTDPYIWFIENYMKTGKCNAQYGAYYIDQKWRNTPTNAVPDLHTLSNHDFFVSRQAFFLDLSPWGDESPNDDPTQPVGTDLAVLKEILLEAYRYNGGNKMCYIGGFPPWPFKYTQRHGGSHGDVDTEWEFVRVISAYNAFQDADAASYSALANASFWQHFPLEEKYPQTWVTHDELKKRGYLTEDGKVDFRGRDFFIFYVGDYDASSWVSQRTPTIWDDANRGKVPLMWCINPNLQERAPMAMHNFRKTATANDYFAAGDNGAGYLMPGMLQAPREISGLPDGLDAWAAHCKKYYDKWGLTVTGFIIDGTAPGLTGKGFDCYASFSPNGIVPQKTAGLTMLHGNMPVMRSDYDINDNAPADAARKLVERVTARNVPFHWFRNILKTPTWYVQTVDEIKRLNPNIELLDAPTFFELYRIWLSE